MSDATEIDYGPLQDLIGVWKGDKGIDVSPEPDGVENSPYHETITFSPIGEVTNAESQVLVALYYRQIVQRKSNDEIFHDETGYWLWDAKAGIIMHSLTIPRGVSVLAGGPHNGDKNSDDYFILEVSAIIDDKSWQIIQSPFMRDHARTTKFSQRLKTGNGRLWYSQMTTVEIYGKVFEHTDQNELMRQ